MVKVRKKHTLTHEEIIQALAARYEHPRYAFFSEVGNAVGFPSNRLDALAMAMWRSLGLEIHGFEIKMHRSDWLRECKQPFKAEELYSYCDRWRLVLGDKSIVQVDQGELPITWGLLVPRGKSLRVEVQAKELKPVALDRKFLASILRKALHATKLETRWQKRPQNTVEELEQLLRGLRASLNHVSLKLDRIKYAIQAAQKQLGPDAKEEGDAN